MVFKIEVVSERKSVIGEGPHWENETQTLLLVDIPAGDVCRLDPLTKKIETRHFDDFVSSVFPIANDKDLLVSLGTKISKLDFETGQHTVLSKIETDKDVRFNDGKCDTTGRLWIGTMPIEKENQPGIFPPLQAALYKTENHSSRAFDLTKQVDKVGLSNGIAWSADNKIMFYIDSLLRRIDAFDYDIAAGSISSRRTVTKFTEDDGFPDGLTIDQQGHLWAAFFNGWKIIELEPESGVTLRTVPLPAAQITSCCFGGTNYEDLYVTSGSVFLSDAQRQAQPDAGAVFKITGLNAKGFPGNAFTAG